MAEIYVPGAIDIMGSANQMMQFRNSQQAQQANALQMQYAAEDRARAAQERSAAAGNARAELVRKQQFMDTIKGGYMPAKTAVMGPGTVQGNTPASFDPEKVKNELLRRGDLSGLVTFSNAQEQFAKQQEQEAKAAGQGLINEETRAKTTGTDYENTKKYIDLTRSQIDAAPDIASLKAIVAATFTPGHPMAKFNELNGLTLEQSMAAIDGLIAKGYLFPQIREQMSQGASKAADNIAARGLVTAQTDKAKGEAGGGGSGGTENERLRLTLLKGVNDPAFVATPEYAAAWNASFGEKIIEMPDPNNPSKVIFQRVRAPAPDMYPRPTFGQQSNALAPAPVAAQPTNALAMNAGGYGGAPMPTPQTSTAIRPDMRTETGEGMLAKVPTVSDAQIKEQAKVKGKSDVTQILGTLLKDYNSLEEMKAIPSENRSVAENIPAYLGATALGQEAGKAVGTKAQTLRTNVQSNARFLLTAIKNATGMSAQEMNSIPELQALQEAVTKPTQSIESVRDIIANVDKLYGTGGLKIEAAPKTEAPAKTEDKSNIAKLSDIEHTAKVNNLSVEDVKARVRAKGMTIEGE